MGDGRHPVFLGQRIEILERTGERGRAGRMEQVLLLFWRIGPEPGRDRGWTAATGWQWPPARKGKARNIKEKAKGKTMPGCTKKGPGHTSRPLYMMARPEGFEPPTLGFEVRCSIQLSYRRGMDRGGKACGARSVYPSLQPRSSAIGRPGRNRPTRPGPRHAALRVVTSGQSGV